MPQRGGDKALFKKQREDVPGDEKNHSQPSKKARIIVRNLPFKNLTEKALEDIFSEYGEIAEIKLLRKADGKFVGCGFIQFKTVKSAAKAIHLANQKEVNGRKIILDWALPKNTYLEKVKKLNEQNSSTASKIEESDAAENNEIEFYIDKKPDPWADESETENEKYNKNIEVKSGTEDESEDEDGDEGDDEDEDEDEFEDEHEEKYKEQKKMEPKVLSTKPSDAEDGKTVFIRNIPFSATNDDLRECFLSYGPVAYALICIDKLTEHSKGTAFVKFKSSESASQCVKDSTKIYLHDAPLTVTFALTKEHLERKKSNKKVVKDNRNLYLVREGVIAAGTKAASGVSASDMNKRLQLEQWKSQILKNLNMFVSRTRLVIHNLPPNYDDEKLKRLFAKHGNPKAVIREAKVMWEKKKFDSKGKHVSKEVGFVSFANHEDALTALRNINNNPNIFNPSKRPIVAFSIENKAVLNQKQKRIEKSRAKLGVTIDEKLSRLNRKQRRFIRRKEKIIMQRREAKKLRESQEGEEKKNNSIVSRGIKRKEGEETEKVGGKRQKVQKATEEAEFKAFTGVTSERGKIVKPRTRFNLKKQATIHSETLKREKMKRKLKQKRNLEPTKQPRQKKGKRKLADDAKLSRLISKHRESIQSSSSSLKKWYES